MAAPVTDAEWLTWVTELMEASVAPGATTRGAPDRFCCLLDEQPTHLVPERLLRQLQPETGEGGLRFNPHCHLTESVAAPDGSGAAVPTLPFRNHESGSVAWVEDSASATWTPFWMSRELAKLVAGIQAGSVSLGDLPEAVLKVLQQAQILVPSTYLSRRESRWIETCAKSRRKFGDSGYAPIAGLIHPFYLSELRRYFRRKIRTGAIRLGDGQSPRRYVAHNDPAARFVHVQLTRAVSDLVGETVKPSYVYMASYQSGARLERHTDRAQCEFSVTLCLDYSPEPREATRWPLYLDTPAGTVTVFQALGDALLYRGRELPHYRETLAAGHSSTSIFFHYVAADFDGPLE